RPKVVAIILVVLQDRVNALECGLGEYPIGAECCPMCASGSRVFKHCTKSSSTTCVPCVEDTYMDHPNGLSHCKICKLCDKGANLVVEAACTYTRNTVCGCPPGYFCSSAGAEDCELCQRYTACVPDSSIKERGTKTTDNVCEACPPGTFSTASMPYSCTQSKLQENGKDQGKDSITIAASVCSLIVLVGITVLIYIWQRKKRKSYVPRKYKQPVHKGVGEQHDQERLPVECEDQTMLPVQETSADPQECKPE
ncbi:TNR14 factor, partial [Brachypteracias leptosomus]|nr:TNR14 factor [Brachypteracias leptosomus]